MTEEVAETPPPPPTETGSSAAASLRNFRKPEKKQAANHIEKPTPVNNEAPPEPSEGMSILLDFCQTKPFTWVLSI